MAPDRTEGRIMRRGSTGGQQAETSHLQSHGTPVQIIFNWLEEDLNQSIESFEVARGADAQGFLLVNNWIANTGHMNAEALCGSGAALCGSTTPTYRQLGHTGSEKSEGSLQKERRKICPIRVSVAADTGGVSAIQLIPLEVKKSE